MKTLEYQKLGSSRSLFKVNYLLPVSRKREIVLSAEELDAWLRQSWLRDRIISFEKIVAERNIEA